MNNRLFALLLAVLLLLVATPLVAQAPKDEYVVQNGDNLWMLAGEKLKDPLLWQKIYEKNPFLQQSGRRFEKDGIIYVLIRPGEKLMGLEELGIIPSFTPLPEPKVERVIHVLDKVPNWMWWLLALLGLIALVLVAYLIYNARVLEADPVTARPPVVRGGVNHETAPVTFQQMAARNAGHRPAEATRPTVYQNFTILNMTAGRIWGVLNVRYADGRETPRRLNGDRAYRAEVRFPEENRTETLYMLQGCGNDLRYGGISRYLPGPEFRFEADHEIVAPTPAPATSVSTATGSITSEPVVPPVQPTESIPVPVEQQGVVRFEFRRATNGKPAMVRLSGIETEEFDFSVGPDGTTLRYRETVEKKADS